MNIIIYMKINSFTSIEKRIDFLLEMIKNCEGCYRSCHINRYQSNKTYCRTGIQPSLYYYSIVDDHLFFNQQQLLYLYFQHCNLRCVYCIDYDIHHNQTSESNRISLYEYSNILKKNLSKNIKGIYLSNVDHIIPHTIYALYQLLKENISIPIIFESNGFALNTTLHFLENLITVYIANFKFITPEYARLYLKEENYPEIAKNSLREMYNQVGDCKIEDQYIQKGLMIKLLILPGFKEEYKKILDYILSISNKIGIFILSNYQPAGKVLKQELYKKINLPTPKEEIQEVVQYAKELGFDYIKVF